jgi:hypothetical protein
MDFDSFAVNLLPAIFFQFCHVLLGEVVYLVAVVRKDTALAQ